MPRFILKSGLAVGLAAVAFAGRAPAQFLSVPNPVTGGQFNYLRFNAMSLNLQNTPVGQFRYSQLYIGPPVAPMIVNNPYRSGYMSGGFGGASYADPRAGQKQKDLAKAQKQAKAAWGNADARAAIADQWAYERGAKAALATAPAPGAPPRGVNVELLDAAPAEIVSGAALNELLAVVRPLDEKARRAVESPLLPPDLAARIAFAGGPTADAVNLLRAGVLDFPAALRGPEFGDLRAELVRSFAQMVESVRQPRPAVVAATDQVLAGVRKGRDVAAPHLPDLAYPDAIEVARFFNRLEAAAKLLRDPNAAAAYVPNWASFGVTVKELARHMAKYHLAFAPAASADGSAYEVLHRGLVGYYLALAQSGP